METQHNAFLRVALETQHNAFLRVALETQHNAFLRVALETQHNAFLRVALWGGNSVLQRICRNSHTDLILRSKYLWGWLWLSTGRSIIIAFAFVMPNSRYFRIYL
ncbi:hypothetical protein MAL08_07785 [Leptospira noguchii]|uniref:hypothetical protein n=1 Tax=Leptospira noguchii TaxID=28182 RepID=UPI001FB6627A|nr:hypothetical protein [Leptospira noguchii]UOG39156.1 hypothetical protein MAL08_07785 [Leptospira noguchii]